MKPFLHAKVSAKTHGGKWEDYIEIHEFIDSSKVCVPDIRHRALFHNSMGPYLAARIFGDHITNSDGKIVSVRDVVEEHIIQDLGFIPTVEKWLDTMPINTWMSGARKYKIHDQIVVD